MNSDNAIDNLALLIYSLDLFGVAVFAITGALVARDKKLDIFGGIVLAFVTAVGGGTFRDLVLGMPRVFWVDDPNYLIVAVIAALATFAATRVEITFPKRTLSVADAFGLALFSVIGAQKALSQDVPAIIAAVLGMLTGVGGGLIRDVLAGQIPLILRREIYATAAFCGATLFVLLQYLQFSANPAIVVSILAALILRLAAIRWNWSLPIFPQSDSN